MDVMATEEEFEVVSSKDKSYEGGWAELLMLRYPMLAREEADLKVIGGLDTVEKLKLRFPCLTHEAAVEMLATGLGPITQALLQHPGLTREAAEEQLAAHGF
ncbi:MAG TPA: hypothetical protein VFI23_02580 [Rhizomicrobium sp.]|nr:hypothetical protein [Rhizomicrobium sp.]